MPFGPNLIQLFCPQFLPIVTWYQSKDPQNLATKSCHLAGAPVAACRRRAIFSSSRHQSSSSGCSSFCHRLSSFSCVKAAAAVWDSLRQAVALAAAAAAAAIASSSCRRRPSRWLPRPVIHPSSSASPRPLPRLVVNRRRPRRLSQICSSSHFAAARRRPRISLCRCGLRPSRCLAHFTTIAVTVAALFIAAGNALLHHRRRQPCPAVVHCRFHRRFLLLQLRLYLMPNFYHCLQPLPLIPPSCCYVQEGRIQQPCS